MKQLTIRGFDNRLRRRIEQVAQEEGISLNKAVLRLLAKGAGLSEESSRADVLGNSLDDLIGTWSDAEEKQFLEGIEAMEVIDPSMWS